jgi:uncharacterized protein YndB with AHSA1/START domain
MGTRRPKRDAAPEPVPAPVGWTRLDVEVPIAAPVGRVWTALTVETAAWWTGDFLVAGPGSRFHLECRPGGRMYEEVPGGSGVLWFHVTVVEPEKRLDFAGDVGVDWGGPFRSQVSIRLAADGAGTRLTLTDALIGPLAARTPEALSSGWRTLFGTQFRSYVESAPR